MLTSPDRRIVISNLGWVDKSALWTYDAEADHEQAIQIGDAKYLTLFPCKVPGQFAILHHYDGSRIRLSIHSFKNPAIRLASIERAGTVSSVEGDEKVLRNARRYYAAFFDSGQGRNFHLLRIDAEQGQIRADNFDWYDRSYRRAHQGIVGLLELPHGNVIVSIQRDSCPVLYDPATRRVIRKLTLAGRAGSPVLCLLPQRREVWASDYDTILKLDIESMKVKGSRRLQQSADGTAHFIGRWNFNHDGSLCIVPRPFSGDVVAISTGTLRVRYAARLGGQPLEATVLNGKRVIARDMKTGALLRGSFRRTWFV